MSEIKSDEKNGKQTDKDIDKLEKQAKGFKKGTIGLGVLTVGAAVGAILTFALGGPVVLGVILIIAEFGFGAGATGCSGRYGGIQKSIEVVKKKEKIKNKVEEELKSKEQDFKKAMKEEKDKNEQLKKEKENLQKENKELKLQFYDPVKNNGSIEQKKELNAGLNLITNINESNINTANAGNIANNIKTGRELLQDFY